MSISITLVNALAGLVKSINYLMDKLATWKRNRRIKHDYRDVKKRVKKRDIEWMNKLLR